MEEFVNVFLEIAKEIDGLAETGNLSGQAAAVLLHKLLLDLFQVG